ncbi:MAG: DMT family transporter [Dehalococcoidia bacterium]
MTGELAAIGSAFMWAVSSIIFAALPRQMEPLVVNVLRMIAASLFFGLVIALVAAFGTLGQLTAAAGLSLVGTAVVTVSLGDTLYIRSLAIIGVARGVPISNTLFPLLTFVLAFAFLGEEVTWPVALGVALVLLGIYLLARPAAQGNEPRPRGMPTLAKGVALALAAGTAWALGTIWLRTVMDDESISPVTANSVRVPPTALALLLFMMITKRTSGLAVRRYRRWTLTLAAASGIVGSVGALLFIIAVQEAGAGKTAVLASTAPLFALPMAVLLLAERPTAKVVAGTALAVAGIFLIV